MGPSNLPKNPPVSIIDACEAIGIYIEYPKTFRL
jgi:hypothetical protein